RRLWTAMGMCFSLAVEDKRTMPQNKIPDNLATTLHSGRIFFLARTPPFPLQTPAGRLFIRVGLLCPLTVLSRNVYSLSGYGDKKWKAVKICYGRAM
uniref:hypothetical protein n=1 Tax=uncultured Desulfovibrio sp. TaxID=167968 RepID=UPI00262EF401